MKKIIILKLTLIFCFLLTGCWDANEPERMYYAHGMGVDYKKGKTVIYLQIISLQNIANQEKSGPTSKPVEVGYDSGETFDEAIFNLYKQLDRRVYWGHLSYIIFSDEAIKHNVLPYVSDFLDRYRETRYRIFYYATKGDIVNELLTTPIGGLSMVLSKLSDPSSIYGQSSVVNPVNMREMIIGLYEPNHQIAIPFITMGKKWKDVDKKSLPSIEVNSIAVLSGAKNTKIKGILSGPSIYGLRLLEKKSHREILPLKKDGKIKGTFIAYVGKKKIKPIVKNGKTTFQITIKVNASIEAINQHFHTSELKKMISDQIKYEIKKTYLRALKKDIDIYRLSEVLYRKDHAEWKKLQINGQIPLDKNSIELIIKPKIKDTGKQKNIPTL